MSAGRQSKVVVWGLLLMAALTLGGCSSTIADLPVVGMPSTLHPASPMWRAATPQTRLAFLADQAQLELFSAGDLVMLFGGILIVAICLHRTLKIESSLNCKRLRWILRKMNRHKTWLGKAQVS